MAFCIALIHAGFVPALFVFLVWSLPGAIGMYGLSLGVQGMHETLPRIVYALLSGMNASTVGIVALAAVQASIPLVKENVTVFVSCIFSWPRSLSKTRLPGFSLFLVLVRDCAIMLSGTSLSSCSLADLPQWYGTFGFSRRLESCARGFVDGKIIHKELWRRVLPQ